MIDRLFRVPLGKGRAFRTQGGAPRLLIVIPAKALTIDRNLEGVGNFLIARAFSEHGQNDVIESGLGGRRVWTL